MCRIIQSLWFHPSFSCEVHVDVDPAASVEVVQVNIAALLSSTFSYDFLNVSADPNSISILPVGTYSLYNMNTCIVDALLCVKYWISLRIIVLLMRHEVDLFI